MASSFDSIVGQYLSDPTIGGATPADVKKAEVAAASEAKKAALPTAAPAGPQEQVPFYNVAAVRQRGSGLSTITDPTQRELATMDNWSLYNRYGSRAGELFDQYNVGAAGYAADRQTPGTVKASQERAQDAGIAAGQGLANSVLGIGSLGLGLVSDTAGTWSARKLGELNEWMDSGKSDRSEIRRRLYGVENSLDTADNREQYEEDRTRDGEFVATLKRFGRDTIDTVGNVWNNNEMLRDTVMQGTGSLLAGGPMAKGLKLVGKAALGRAVASGAIAEGGAVASNIAAYGSRAAMPATIGAMEAGGAYQQAIMDSYTNLDQRSDLTDDQKAEMANNAGLTAAAIQGPVAALTGTLVSKFEANPFAGVTARTAVQNILKEGLEEGIQSATGQLAQNVGIKQNVDQNRDLMEGVGEQTALGAIGGLGSAGLIEAPHIALRSAVGAAKLTGRGVSSLGSNIAGGLENRNQRILDQVAAESPVAAPRMDAAIDAARTAAPEIRQNIEQTIQNNPSFSDEERNSVISHFDSVMRFDEDQELARVPSVIGEAIRGSEDRFDAVRRVTGIAGDAEQAPENRLAAGLYLMDTLRRNQTMIENIPEAVEKLPDDDAAVQQVNDYQTVLESLQRHPAVREAIQAAIQFSSQITPESVSDERISTPEGQQAAQNAVQISSLAPDRANPEVNNQVLLHAREGRLNLTPEQVGYLQSANALKSAEQRLAERSEALGLTNSEAISREIQTDKSDPGTLHKSAISHMEGITAAVDAGNIPLASRRMQHFMNFAQSMQNKVGALNASLMAGNGSDQNSTPYEAYNPRTGKFFTSKPGAYLIGSSRGSVAQAQQTAVDADAVGYLANELAKSFPQLQTAPIELAQLNAAVSQTPAREAARDYRIAQRDGTLAQFMNENAVTSPNIPVDRVLSATLQDVDQNNRQEKSAPIEVTPTPRRTEDVVPGSLSDLDPSLDQRTSDAVPASTTETVPVGQLPSGNADAQSTLVSPDADTAPVAVPEAAETPAVQAPVELAPVDRVSVPDQAQVAKAPEASEEKSPKVSGIDATYPNLLGSKNDGGGKSLFKQAFTLPADEPISRLTGVENPVLNIRNALSSASKFRSQVGGNESGNRITTDVARAYSSYLGFAEKIGQEMDNRLNSTLEDRARKGKKFDPAFEELRALAATDESSDGQALLSYNEELRQNAVVAGFQWLLTADQRQKPLDDEGVARILGIPTTSVTEDQVTRFNQGFHLGSAISDLSSAITRYWGVRSNADAPDGFVKGVPEGVAKEVLRGMEAAGLLSINEIKENGKTYYQVQSLAEEKLGKETYEKLMTVPSAIEMASITDPEEVSFIGAPPSKIATAQLRNPLVRLTNQQTQMIENEQATPHYLNLPVVQFLESLGEDASVDLFGYGELSETAMNRNHRQSLESVNLTVRSAVRSIMMKRSQVESWARAQGVDVEQAPIHYAYEFTSVNRLQMMGKHNPQANKVTREAILPTRSTLDMTDPADRDRFMLGVAQAWGVKVHKKIRAESVREAQELAEGRFAPAIQILSDWLGKSGTKRITELSSDDVQTLKQTLGNGGPVPAVALHAAMEYARLQRTEDKSAFTTSLYVEADGITDGPINAMVHAVRGAFTSDWLNVVRKGGLFFGQPGMTANRSSDNVDLYQHTTNFLKQSMATMRRDLLENIPVRNQMDTLLRVMGQLLPDVGFDQETGELVIQRGAVKNPLTVTIYGAGPSGIANKITSALTKAVYERESQKLAFLDGRPKATQQEIAEHLFGAVSSSPAEAARKYAEYNSDMATLLNSRVEKSDGSMVVADTSADMPKNTSMKSGAQNFTMLPQQVGNLQQNVLRLFVGPMREAIAASIGETEQGVSALRRATQVQSIYLQYAFKRAVQEALDRKAKDVPGFKKSDFLSQKELKGIYDKLRHLAPFVETGTQNMLVSGSEKSDVGDVSFSRDITGKLSTPAYVYGPMNSGVSGIPLTIIGTGDGQMMQNVSTMPGAPEGTLKIFDGMNMKLTTIEDDSRAVNEAVYQGWLQNPLGDVARGFSEFVRDAELGNLSDQQRSDLSEALLGQGKKGATQAQIIEMIQGLNTEFQDIAQEIQARKNVLARVQVTVDHMASAEASYDSKAEINLEGLSDDQIVSELNRLYAEELNKLVADKAKRPSENIKRDLAAVENIQGNDLLRFVNKLNIPPAQKSLMIEAARALRNTDWKVTTQPAGVVNPGFDVYGITDMGSRTIHVMNGSSETLLHEMIHASTMDKVYQYYVDEDVLSQEEQDAVKRIEILMRDWLDNSEADFSELNEEIQAQFRDAQTTILSLLGDANLSGEDRISGAVNEFMAWVLSNQSLARAAERTKVRNPLGRIVSEALKALKALFGFKDRVGNDLYSNLRFNTAILMNTGRPVAAQLNDTILFQATQFGSSDRLTKLRQQFFDKVARHIYDQPNPAAKLTAQYKSFVAQVQSDAVLASFNAHGFPMDKQQSSTFQMMVAALATEIQLNTNSLQRVQELYAHVSKTLKVEDFMTDPESTNPADRFTAQEKYNSILGTNLTEIDEQGRSTLLPAFLALAAVDDGFRSVLSQMELPKGERMEGETLDARLTNLGSEMMDQLGVMMGGEGRNQPSVQAAIDVLTDRLAFVGQDQKDFIDQFVSPAGTAIDKANKFVIDQMTSLSQRASDKLEDVKQRTNKKSVRALANIGQLTAGIFNEDIASAQAESLMSAANKYLSSKTLHEFLNELVGRTAENASVYDMIKRVRSDVQQMRQQFREHLPELLSKRFSRPVTDTEQSAMYRGLAKTDLASLRSGYSVTQIVELLTDPNKVASETQLIESRLKNIQNGSVILGKARELADYMNTGRAPAALHRNAYAIARLAGKIQTNEDGSGVSPIVQDIDHLVSLYAVDGMNQADRDALSSLVQDQKDGVSFVLSYLEGQRRDELAGAQGNEVAMLNHFKGYVPSTQEGKAFGRTLLVADDAEYLSLRQRGFQRASDYIGMEVEKGGPRKGYYFSSLSGRSSYNQGILQTVHATVSGVDPVTGFSTSISTAGKITDPDAVQRVQRRLSRNQKGNEQLMPVFDKDGNVVAYERSLDPLQEERLGRSTNLMNMMGVWRGRQVEEGLAQRYNDALVDRLHSMWDGEEVTRKSEYVNLFDRREQRADPVLADAVKLIPRQTRDRIASLYGENQFWVRRDMLNDAVGYRKASIGDAWTGTTRYSEETQKNIRSLATNVFGVDAFKRIIQAEKTYENFITDARVTIVVKSVIVPFGNLVNNIFQLSARGVPLATTVKGMPRKTAEVDGYIKGRLRVMEIDAEIRAAEGANDVISQRKLGVEKQSLEDGWKRLSIWPLIEAGELTSVSDVGLGREEIDLTEGRLNEYMEKLTEKLPDSVKTAGKYFIVSKDTALFKGLQKAVEYGDFLAKAILYDDLTKRQGLTSEQALAKVTEEYVNYDRLSGRTRDKLESMGLLWFWHFKVRSVKVALSMIRNNPVHAFLTMLTPTLPVVGDIGNPITDNVVTQAVNNQLGYSLGPTRALSAHQMNPWIGMVF